VIVPAGEPFKTLRALFSDAGYIFVEPPIVHDAGVFVELAGEDLRRRLFLTVTADGSELALRPDYTIPVCLHHLASGPARRRADYAYLGPVFRQRKDEPGEFLQAGVESIGRADRVAADADVLKLALQATRLLGVRRPAVRIGDSALFAAVLDALDLPSPWQKRLARAFGDTVRLNLLIARAKGGSVTRVGPAGADRATTRTMAEDMLAAAGLLVIGGRTADEIADRVAEKSVLAAGIGAKPARILEKFLKISDAPQKAAKAMRALARAERLAIGPTIDFFERRNDAFVKGGIDLAALNFAADFGRRLDYYTGFVFDIRSGRRETKPIVGGGRYDRMLGVIQKSRGTGKGEALPAVGFSIWLDRAGGRQ
jgi:ATP phosphoribosyltransferase regulatory subunit